MATAVGTYATTSAAKTRLGITDTTDDALLGTLCDQVNQWIESFTGRILAPLPTFSTTLSGAAAVGDTTVTLASVAGLAVNDALMFGPLSGTHESVAVLSISGTTVTLNSALVNAYASGATAERVYVFDGFDALEGQRCLPIRRGIQYVTSLEVATFSAGAGGATTASVVWYRVPNADFFLRPTPQERQPGWPATEIWITNVPSPSDTTPAFYPGFANVRIRGALCWAAVPDDVTEIALNLVVALYRARGAGGGDTITIDTDGARTYERLLSATDKAALARYRALDAWIV